MQYTVDYFINKFEAIPENRWGIGSRSYHFYSDAHCALGHCNTNKDIEMTFSHFSEEGKALTTLLSKLSSKKLINPEMFVFSINDGWNDTSYPQPTPKQRILAALYDVKKMQTPEVKEEKVKTVYVTVAPEILSNSAVHFSEAYN